MKNADNQTKKSIEVHDEPRKNKYTEKLVKEEQRGISRQDMETLF